LAFVKRWKLWHLCILMILTTYMRMPLMAFLIRILPSVRADSDWSLLSTIIHQGAQAFSMLLIILFWFWLGTRLFEAGMTEQPCPLHLGRSLRRELRRTGNAIERIRRYGVEK